MKFIGSLAVFLVSCAAYAQAWNLENDAVKLPRPTKGATIESASIACKNDVLLLSVLPNANVAPGTPAAFLVDGKLFAAMADNESRFALPNTALDALKKGKNFTINITANSGELAASYGLQGSSKVLDALKSKCEVVPTIAFESAPSYAAASRIELAHTIPPDLKKHEIRIVLPGTDPKETMLFGVGRPHENPAILTAPAKPGTYELRLVDRTDPKKHEILYSKPVVITEAEPAVVTGAPTAIGASRYEVSFSGPNGRGNFVGIFRKDAPAGNIDSFHSNMTGNVRKVTVSAPVTPGEYELRFVASVGDRAVLATQPVTVTAAPAITLQPLEATVGSTVTVPMPAGVVSTSGDHIFIARPSAHSKDNEGGSAQILGADRVEIKTPAEPGDWEIRYVSFDFGNYVVRGRAPLKVK